MPVHDWTRVDAGIFHDFHMLWLVGIRIRLGELLPPEYYVLAEQKALGFGPDILTLGRGPSRPKNGSVRVAGSADPKAGGGVDLAVAPPKTRFAVSRPTGYKQRSIVVRRVENDRIVAVIEIVSPGNKSSGHAIRAFVAKAGEFLASGVHLVVIDLFPPTPRDPHGIHEAIWGPDDGALVPRLPERPLTLVSYAAGTEERAYVEPLAVGDPLPSLPLFLEPDLYLPLPLEETYTTAFKAVPRPYSDILTAPPSEGDAHGA